MKLVPIAEIKTESGTQTRVKINEETVAEYAEAMGNGAEFPPVIVYHDGTDYYMADGFHRIMAAARVGHTAIMSDIRKGTRQDALVFALGANCTNGLRRTNEDKRRCVENALREFTEWGDRKIAEVCGVHNQTVANIKATQVSNLDTCTEYIHPKTRTGRDGKQYPAHRTTKTASPTTTEPFEQAHPSVDPKTTRPCVGLMHAENAIRQLEKISRRDTEYAKALNFVLDWIETKLEAMTA